MARQADNGSDDRLNELTDSDPLWGPLLSFRPEKNRCFTCLRALALAATFGGFYGTVISLALALICRGSRHHPPAVYSAPSVLIFACFVCFQLSLGSAWNRRARLLARREVYLRSVAERIPERHH